MSYKHGSWRKDEKREVWTRKPEELMPTIGLPIRPVERCHHDGTKPALTLSDGRLLYAAQGYELMKIGARVDHLDLIVDCARIVVARRFIVSAPRRYQSLNRLAWPDVMNLHWPDMSAPVHVKLPFWQTLVDLLPHATCVCCMGGHGRTGTAVACLLVADGVEPASAIQQVREKHCSKAIETVEQENYIKSLKGRV